MPSTARAAARSRQALGTTGSLVAVVLVLGVVRWLQQHQAVAWSLAALLLAAAAAKVTVAVRKYRKRRRKGRATGKYLALDAGRFEQAVAALMSTSGATGTRIIGGSGDLGADVIGYTRSGRKVVVQCKRYDRKPVGSPDVQRFVGTAVPHHHADVAVLVTTSRFTVPALRYASEHSVLTVDGEQLAEWERTGYVGWL
ncbi:restriction endonuclease [Streptomyces sp. NPDC088732]|uniref:restriction endonuclease n=1 Tax=Streptomyces sp. NPDC088732 TaxID=3365879 RepID=UPI0038096383